MLNIIQWSEVYHPKLSTICIPYKVLISELNQSNLMVVFQCLIHSTKSFKTLLLILSDESYKGLPDVPLLLCILPSWWSVCWIFFHIFAIAKSLDMVVHLAPHSSALCAQHLSLLATSCMQLFASVGFLYTSSCSSQSAWVYWWNCWKKYPCKYIPKVTQIPA